MELIFLLKYVLQYSVNECYNVNLCVLSNDISSCNCITPNVRIMNWGPWLTQEFCSEGRGFNKFSKEHRTGIWGR